MGFATYHRANNKNLTLARFIDEVSERWHRPGHANEYNDNERCTAEELEQLYELIRQLCSLRWAGDADGDLPIWPVELAELHSHERSHWNPVPQYGLIDAGKITYGERFRAVQFNLSQAFDQFNNTIRCMNDEGEGLRSMKGRPEGFLGSPLASWKLMDAQREREMDELRKRNAELQAQNDRLYTQNQALHAKAGKD